MRFLRVAFLGAILVLAVPGKSFAQTFSDVPANYWAYSFIETFAARGITSGCGNGEYCPEDRVTRAQMAVFLERGMQGAGFVPPPATGTLFGDVAANDFAAAFIEQLFADGITGGCGNGDYCPGNNVTRAQMAVFLLRAMHGSGYAAPPAIGVFNDVPLGSFADAWIEQLAVEQITSGCGGGNFCPNDSVTRAQMAVFIVRALLEPSVLSGIQLSQSSIILDRWGDTAVINATAVDQDGIEVPGATITWMSSDTNVAAVDDSGNVSTWLGGDVVLTVEASKDTVTVNDTVAVNVAIQQNSNCTVPTEFPVQGPVAPPSLWEPRWVPTQFIPDGATGGIEIARQITLDVDRDGDPDLLSMTHTPELLGIGVPIDTAHRIWLNDGSGNFTDSTDAILGGNEIPWNAPRHIDYADFDGDGFEDVVVFQQGWEHHENGCGNGPGSCPGGPNLLFLPQPADFRDSAPSRLSPYDLNGFTHSGAVGDIDCDGNVDILEANWGNSDADAPHRLQLNSGSGTFISDHLRLPQELLDNAINSSALCDLDRDGDLDLVTGLPDSPTTQHVRVSVNDGFGQFRMLDADVLPDVESSDGMDCADVDRNGYDDIVPSPGGSMVLIENLGNMSFTDITASALPPNPSVVTSTGKGIIDLNGDGWPEITPQDDNAIYWNAGGGVYVRSIIPELCCGTFIAIADFDGDGQPDIYHHFSNDLMVPDTLYLNRPAPAPVRLVFATSSLYNANLGGLSGADAICQQHASAAGLAGTYVAFLSDSTTDALNRLSHGEFRRVGDNAIVVPSKLELRIPALTNPVANDETGTEITQDQAVRTGTEHSGFRRRPEAGVGFCSNWTRGTDEDPGTTSSGFVSADAEWWVWAEDRPCSEPQRLYCFQQ